jgi:hypothetical protein
MQIYLIFLEISYNISLFKECVMFPPSFKQRMIKAGIKDTALVCKHLNH